MRYFFHIAYHGYYYAGWQKNPAVNSVQEVIEEKLSKIFKTEIHVNGCGRTDAQVHASQFFFHVDFEKEWDFDLLFRLNKILPHNIAVFDIVKVDDKHHARFSAVQRKYDYFIHTYKDPFLSLYSSFYLGEKLDLPKMKLAVALLPKYNDYRAFCTSPDKYEHTICMVSDAKLYINSKGDRLRFQITSNRYLAKMIRIIVSKLLLIGNGKLSVEEFESYLITKNGPMLLPPAHPTGLYLSKVTYPFLDLPMRTEFLNILHNNEDWQLV